MVFRWWPQREKDRLKNKKRRSKKSTKQKSKKKVHSPQDENKPNWVTNQPNIDRDVGLENSSDINDLKQQPSKKQKNFKARDEESGTPQGGKQNERSEDVHNFDSHKRFIDNNSSEDRGGGQPLLDSYKKKKGDDYVYHQIQN